MVRNASWIFWVLRCVPIFSSTLVAHLTFLVRIFLSSLLPLLHHSTCRSAAHCTCFFRLFAFQNHSARAISHPALQFETQPPLEYTMLSTSLGLIYSPLVRTSHGFS